MTHDQTKLLDWLQERASETDEDWAADIQAGGDNPKPHNFYAEALAALRRPTPPPDVAKLREAGTDGWRSDCPRCVGSKFPCDEHYAPQDAPSVDAVPSDATKRMAKILGCEFKHDPKWEITAVEPGESEDAPSAPPSDEVERIVALVRTHAEDHDRGFRQVLHELADAIERGDWRNSAAHRTAKEKTS